MTPPHIYFLLSSFIFFFYSSFVAITTSTPPPPYPYGLRYHINCGSSTNTTDPFNTTWLSDRFATGGIPALVSEPLHFPLPSEKTLRYFPSHTFGKKNCYSIPSLPPSRYLIRTFTVYDNYDARSNPPSFDVAVSSTVVFSWRSPWPESTARDGAYSDLFTFIGNSSSTLDLCFYGFATDAPVVSSVELFQVDPTSYHATAAGENHVLVNYGRISCGSASHWGPGFTNHTDRFGRTWQPDTDFRTRPENPDEVRVVVTENVVEGADVEPNYFPMRLYQTAVTGEGVLEYKLGVDAKMNYMVWLHFAEIDSSVKKEGERVFDVFVNERNVSRVDIYKEVGSFAAFAWHYTVKNLSDSMLSVRLVAAVGAPIISGIENYALLPHEPSTLPQQGVFSEI